MGCTEKWRWQLRDKQEDTSFYFSYSNSSDERESNDGQTPRENKWVVGMWNNINNVYNLAHVHRGLQGQLHDFVMKTDKKP